jgi:hypothetical protein
MAVWFLGSCQELEEEPMQLEASVEEKFDRDMFLASVHQASLEYAEGIRNPKKNINFRTVYDSDMVIHDYIESVASRMNTPQNYFKVIPEETWDDPYQGHVFTQEADLDKNTLSPRVRMHVDQLESAVDQIANRYESGLINEDQVKSQLKSSLRTMGNTVSLDFSIPSQERGDIADIFYTLDGATDDIALLLQDPAIGNASFFKRFVRALVRTILVAAVSAAIVYTGGLAAGVIKFKSAFLGHKLGWAALTKKATIGASGKLYPALTYGLGKGAIEAVQKWDKPWEGLKKEAKYAVKAVW